jgi:hypothetical protein
MKGLLMDLDARQAPRLFWQAEILRRDELYDIDFPQRADKADAIQDAWERWSTFTPRERMSMEARVAEWFGLFGSAESTGESEWVTDGYPNYPDDQ